MRAEKRSPPITSDFAFYIFPFFFPENSFFRIILHPVDMLTYHQLFSTILQTFFVKNFQEQNTKSLVQFDCSLMILRFSFLYFS